MFSDAGAFFYTPHPKCGVFVFTCTAEPTHPHMENVFVQYEPWEKYKTTPPTRKEVREVIEKLKRRKAPGPDEIPVELLKEMTDTNLDKIVELLTKWWKHEDIREEDLRARVVLIYKKGDTNKFENYRPISLLNALYKIIAAVMQTRISNTLDRHLQTKKKQFGFRKDNSTGDAIHLIRRIIEYGESTRNQLHLLLLDWERHLTKWTGRSCLEQCNGWELMTN